LTSEKILITNVMYNVKRALWKGHRCE
jgi:hypothetical protein